MSKLLQKNCCSFSYNSASPVSVTETVYVVTNNLPEEKDAATQEEKTASHRVQLVNHVNDPLSGQWFRFSWFMEKGCRQEIHNPRHDDDMGRCYQKKKRHVGSDNYAD